MALTTSRSLTTTQYPRPSNSTPFIIPSNPPSSLFLKPRVSQIICLAKKFQSRTGKFDSKNKRSSTSTKEEELIDEIDGPDDTPERDDGISYEGYVLPELPGDKPDFWEGPQWDAFGFFIQYLWAFGILFALISGGVAVATYNEGATDFKETPAYQESIQSREILEDPEASNADVFESNPTEVAPALD